MSLRSDDLYLVDLIEHSESIVRMVETRTREVFDTDEVFRGAVLWNLYVIGEASSKLSAQTRDGFSGVSWSEIRGLRNHLAHGYFQLRFDRIWQIVTVEVPALQAKAEAILTRDFPDVARQLAERRGRGLS